MSRSKIFLWILVSYIAGIGIESFIMIPIVIILGIGLMVMVVVALAWSRKKKNLVVVALVILGCMVGTIRMQYAEQRVPDLGVFSGRRIEVVGVVAEDPKLTEKNQLVLLHVREIDHGTIVAPVYISLLLRKYPVYAEGDIIASMGTFEVKPYNGVTSGILFSLQEEKRGEGNIGIFFRWMRVGKQRFNAHIDAVLPEPHASFMKGLLLGERASMPADLVQKFKQTGVSHIIALSGYNITLVGTLLVDILLILTVPFRATFWIAGSSIILFVLLTGAQASLVRAAIMGILILVAAREGRTYHMTNALVFAGIVMLGVNPYLLRFDVGFQLSFLASLGLIYFTDPVSRVLAAIEYKVRLLVKGKRVSRDKEHAVANGVKKIMSETIAAQLAVLPLLVYLFGGVSLIAPISNLFVLVAVPYAMALGFLTGVAGFISQPLSILIGWGAWVLLAYELAIINFFSTIPLAFVSVSSAGGIFIIVAYGIAGLMWWRKRRRLQDGE